MEAIMVCLFRSRRIAVKRSKPPCGNRCYRHMCTEGIIKGNEKGGFVCMDETARKMLPIIRNMS